MSKWCEETAGSMSLNKQNDMGSSAQMEGLAFRKNTDRSFVVTGGNRRTRGLGWSLFLTVNHSFVLYKL